MKTGGVKAVRGHVMGRWQEARACVHGTTEQTPALR